MPVFGVPEALLSDQGTNLLSYLMCLSRHRKAEYYSIPSSMQWLNRAIQLYAKVSLEKACREIWKTMGCTLTCCSLGIQKCATYQYWREAVLLVMISDLRLYPESRVVPTDVRDYREEVVTSLSLARESAVSAMQKAHKKYKKYCDRHSKSLDYKIGDWIPWITAQIVQTLVWSLQDCLPYWDWSHRH